MSIKTGKIDYQDGILNATYLSDSVDWNCFLRFLTEEASHQFRYIKPVVCKVPLPESADKDYFISDKMAEIELKIVAVSLDNEPEVSFIDEKDFNKKMVGNLLDIASRTFEVKKSDPFLKIMDTVYNEIYCDTCRGGANVIICSPKFLEKHPCPTGLKYNIIVVEGILPDDTAITNYIDERNTDLSIVAYIDDANKLYKLKPLNNYISVIKEM
jgi:hypothetical protein